MTCIDPIGHSYHMLSAVKMGALLKSFRVHGLIIELFPGSQKVLFGLFLDIEIILFSFHV